MKQDLSDLRQEYAKNQINFLQSPHDPIQLFKEWYESATKSEKIAEPNAMSLSTIGVDGFPRTRVVLLKEFNEEGFVFYTNYNSQKGQSIADKSQVCLSFFWHDLEQQIIIKGNAEKVSAEESDAYFGKRPFESQIGAIVSQQSSVIELDVDLDQIAKDLMEKFQGQNVPRPEHWGGFIVKPIEIEFWQGRPSRLHDRLRYRLENQNWIKERLAP